MQALPQFTDVGLLRVRLQQLQAALLPWPVSKLDALTHLLPRLASGAVDGATCWNLMHAVTGLGLSDGWEHAPQWALQGHTKHCSAVQASRLCTIHPVPAPSKHTRGACCRSAL